MRGKRTASFLWPHGNALRITGGEVAQLALASVKTRRAEEIEIGMLQSTRCDCGIAYRRRLLRLLGGLGGAGGVDGSGSQGTLDCFMWPGPRRSGRCS